MQFYSSYLKHGSIVSSLFDRKQGKSKREVERVVAKHFPKPDVPTVIRKVPMSRSDCQARCAFVGQGGRRCRERGFVEFHHVVPYGVGGGMTVDNIALRCRSHNAHESERFYGQMFGGAAREASELSPERVRGVGPR